MDFPDGAGDRQPKRRELNAEFTSRKRPSFGVMIENGTKLERNAF
jgi:hypothetical protein